MKIEVALLMSLLLANMFIAFASIRPVLANPTTLIVPDQYLTIQDAIAHAGQGDTIIVKPGIYSENNLSITKNGITLQGADKTTTIIDGKGTPHLPHAVIVVNADNVVIRGFTIRNATYAGASGVFLNHSNSAYITDNLFSGNYKSIEADYSTNVTVASSTFSGDIGNAGNAAIRTYHCQTGLVQNNSLTASYIGAFVIYTANFMIRNNTFASCNFSVTISHSEQNWVVRNKFMSCDSSIYIKYNGNNKVIGNTISDSKTAGLVLEQNSPNNVIHHNNFISNQMQVKFEGSPPPNIWSNTQGFIAEGNYWSDYTGTDNLKDGIGDAPYTIATGNQDQYPLIGPFTDFTVACQTGTCNVYTISNSTITDFSFNPTAKQINFHVANSGGALGICRVVFPRTLLSQPYAVYVNGKSPPTSGSAWNSTHWVLYFSYIHGSQPLDVIVVLEFSTVVIVVFLLMLTLLTAMLTKKMRKLDKIQLI